MEAGNLSCLLEFQSVCMECGLYWVIDDACAVTESPYFPEFYFWNQNDASWFATFPRFVRIDAS